MSTIVDGLTLDQIVKRIDDQSYHPHDIHGKQLRTVECGGERKRISVEIWEKSLYKYRLQALSMEIDNEFDLDLSIVHNPNSSELESGGDLIIGNRDKIYKYNEKENIYQILNIDDQEGITSPITKPSLIESILSGENYEAEYKETETITGRDTYNLIIRPKEGAGPFYQHLNYIQVWVDTEYWIPIRHNAEYRIQGVLFQTNSEDKTLLQTNSFEEVEFNSGIDNTIFDIEPPDDADEIGL